MSLVSNPIFSETAFDPGVIEVMNQAYAKACRMLHDKGQPILVQEVIARRIVEVAKTGERDPNRICSRVLMDLGLRLDP